MYIYIYLVVHPTDRKWVSSNPSYFRGRLAPAYPIEKSLFVPPPSCCAQIVVRRLFTHISTVYCRFFL